MTVKELIELLSEQPEDVELFVQDAGEVMTLHEVVGIGYVPSRLGRTLVINPRYFD